MLATTLAGSMLTGVAAWLVFGQDKVDRDEMVTYVQTQSPWVMQRGEIQASVKHNSDQLKDLQASVQTLVDVQHALLVEQRVLVTRFDEYLRMESEEGR